REVWTIDPATWVARKLANSQGPAPSNKTANGKAKNHGVYSRWQYVPDYDVFIGYNSARDNVWLYRLPEVPHDAADSDSAVSPKKPETHDSGTASQLAPQSDAPSLPQPGRVVVDP